MDDKGKFIWTVKVSDKGQISIPKQAREVFNINTGDTLIMFGDIDRGIPNLLATIIITLLA